MDVLNELVRVVARSFYEDKYSVFLEFLIIERMYALLHLIEAFKLSAGFQMINLLIVSVSF